MVCAGEAEYKKTGTKIIYEVNCSQLSQLQPSTEITIKMSKPGDSFDTKIPVQQMEKVTKIESIDLDLAIQFVRMAELCAISYKQNSRLIDNICLSTSQNPNALKWISLACGAQINREGLTEALEYCGNSGVVVGCMSGHKSDPIKFVNTLPH